VASMEMTIPAKEVAPGFVLTVNLTGFRWWYLRTALAFALVRLAALIQPSLCVKFEGWRRWESQ